MCMKKWWFIVVLFIVIPSLWAQPYKPFEMVLRKSCGRDLVERVDRICQNRGGHLTITKARRSRRGIVDECCMKKCSDHHIYPYCSNNMHERELDEPETPEIPDMLTMDLEGAESRAPVPMPLKNVIPPKAETATSSPVEKITLGPDYRYHDIYVKDTVDSDFVNRLIKTLPFNSNDFQVGTVPPEYRISGYIPSRARIVRNY